MTIASPPPTFTTADDGPTLHSYVSFVYRYRWMMVVFLLTGVVAGMTVHLTKPVRYTSTAHMVIVATTASGSSSTGSDLSIDSAIQLLRSDEVLGRAAQAVGYPGGTTALKVDLTTRPIVNSRIVRVSVSALDPADARFATSAVVEEFYQIRAVALRQAAEDRSAAVSAEIDVVEDELAQRYGLLPQQDATPQELDQIVIPRDVGGIAPLATRRAQLHGELAALAISEAEPGYPSRPATEPQQGQRSGTTITVASAVTLSMLTAVGMAALHQVRGPRERRPPHTRSSDGTSHVVL